MSEDEDQKGFVVKDRRRFDASGNRREEAPQEESPRKAAPAQAKPQPPPAQKQAPQPPPQQPRPQAAPPAQGAEEGEEEGEDLGFSEFILSIATNAMNYLGEDTKDGRLPSRANLPLAVQHINIIAMLAEKTRGNLTRDEAQLLEGILYDLKMRYVQVAQSAQRGR